jgi:hypothetical protein
MAAEKLLVDQQLLLAVVPDHEPRRPAAKGRVQIIVPQRNRLQHMTIGVDDVVDAAHHPLHARERATLARRRSARQCAAGKPPACTTEGQPK